MRFTRLLIPAFIALLGSAAYAQVTIDMSKSTAAVSSKDTVTIKNVTVTNPPIGAWDTTFTWNPTTAQFDLKGGTAASSGPRKCSAKLWAQNGRMIGTSTYTSTTYPDRALWTGISGDVPANITVTGTAYKFPSWFDLTMPFQIIFTSDSDAPTILIC
jgi:hypothetical protein